MSETIKAYKLKRLRYNRIALVDQGANPFADIVLAKRHEEGTKMADTKADVKVEVQIPESVQKTIEEAKEAVAKAAELEKRLKAAEDEAKAAKAEVAKLEDERIAKAFVAKATEFGGIPGLASESALLRKMYSTLTVDEAKKADELLRAASNSIQASKLLDEIGTSGGFGGDAYQKLEKLARELSKAEKITYEQAFTKVSDTPEGRELLRQHEKEREDAARRTR